MVAVAVVAEVAVAVVAVSDPAADTVAEDTAPMVGTVTTAGVVATV